MQVLEIFFRILIFVTKHGVSGSRTRVRDHQVNVKQTVGTRRKAKATSCCPPLVCSWSSISPAGTAPSGRTRMEGSGWAPGRRAVSVRGANAALHLHPVAVFDPWTFGSMLSPILRAQTKARRSRRRREQETYGTRGASPCYGDKIIRRGEEKEERGVAFPSPHVSVRRWPGPARSCSRKGRGVCRPVEGWRPRRRRRPGSCLGRAWLRRRRAQR